MAQNFEILPLQLSDAKELSEFAARTFQATFAEHNEAEDMQSFLRNTYSAEIQAREISDPQRHFMKATLNGKIVGYVQLRANAVKDGVKGPKPMELQRIYIDENCKGTGLAARLMNAAISLAHEMRFETLWLGVWEHNQRALAFYRKFGFVEVGEHDFYLGRDKQRDLILSKDITRI